MNIHLAPWSSGQDATLSRSNQGFDSPGGQPIKAFNREVEEYKMLVSATEMLKKAKAGHYAVGQDVYKRQILHYRHTLKVRKEYLQPTNFNSQQNPQPEDGCGFCFL